jgi:hypothetical protein
MGVLWRPGIRRQRRSYAPRRINPSGVICEILNDDGTPAQVSELVPFSRMHEIKMITLADLKKYRLEINGGGLVRSDINTDRGLSPMAAEQKRAS